MAMGRYAILARNHWKRHLPTLYSLLLSTDSLDRRLAEVEHETEERVAARMTELLRSQLSAAQEKDLPYLEKARLYHWARNIAEEEIFPLTFLFQTESAPSGATPRAIDAL